jgi:hypothetical protein
MKGGLTTEHRYHHLASVLSFETDIGSLPPNHIGSPFSAYHASLLVQFDHAKPSVVPVSKDTRYTALFME